MNDVELPESHIEEVHQADERWLVSYADMMTLLFGFFVLLYAMSGRFDVIQDSVEKKFGATIAPVELTPSQEQAAKQGNDQLLNMQAKYLAAQADLEKWRGKFNDAENTIEHLKGAMDASVRESSRKIQAVESERQALKEAAKHQVEYREPIIPAAPAPVIASTGTGGGGGSAGLGGNGNSGGGNPGGGNHGGSFHGPYHFKGTFPDGTIYEEDLMQIERTGLQLSRPPPVTFSEKFLITVVRQGITLEIMVRPVIDKNGATGRLEFISFPNRDEQVLDQWMPRRR